MTQAPESSVRIIARFQYGKHLFLVLKTQANFNNQINGAAQ
jgi:hypothetical protein